MRIARRYQATRCSVLSRACRDFLLDAVKAKRAAKNFSLLVLLRPEVNLKYVTASLSLGKYRGIRSCAAEIKAPPYVDDIVGQRRIIDFY
jgi:hypothetical protein